MAYLVAGVELGKMVTPLNSDGTVAGEAYDDGTGGGAGSSALDAQIAEVTRAIAMGGGAAAIALLQQLLGQKKAQAAAQPPSFLSQYGLPIMAVGAVVAVAVISMKKG